MTIDITQLSSEVSAFILSEGISGNLIALVEGEQGEQGDQGLQGEPGAGITGGGLSGQFLIKDGTADYITSWASLTITSGLIGGVYIDTPADGQALIWDDSNQYFTNRDVSGSSSSSSTASTSIRVTQNSHGFSTGEVVYYTGSIWQRALANSTSTLGVGIVQYLTVNTFNVVFSGQVSGFTGLSSGNYYFVSDSLSGGLTFNEPTISNPLLFAISTTSGIVVPWRPVDNSAFESDYINITGGITDISAVVDYIYCDCTTSGITANLLSVSEIPGKSYTFKKLDSTVNVVNIQPNGAEALEGGIEYNLTGQNTSITIGNNGIQWYIHNIYRS